MKKDKKILIIGAGLCGSLLALRLAQSGYQVVVYESRPDLRTTDVSSGRSINLALSKRGLYALEQAGIAKKVSALCIPMHGRLIHDSNGNTFSSNYSGREGEYINSISRDGLNSVLLSEADKNKNVTLHFNKKCKSVDIENNKANFECYLTKEAFTDTADVILGADGAGSSLRKSYDQEKKFLFSYSQNFLTHGYKELEIPADKLGNHQISKEHLHIWPRGKNMLIALPNLDGSFTVTLFLSYTEGTYNFENLKTPEEVTAFFKDQFPDALSVMPSIEEAFFKNPTGALGTIKCSPWHYKNKTLLLGDAAHAIVPFYGQGMNASFEDVTVFNDILEAHNHDWEATFNAYELKRKKDTDAIADLALDNYLEMRDHVANPIFKEKRKLEMLLEKTFPETYFSKYSMVTFKNNLGYAKAKQIGRAQDKALLNLIADDKIDTTKDLKKILNLIQKETAEILEEDKIAGLQ